MKEKPDMTKRKQAKTLRSALDKSILSKAEKIVAEYRLIIQRDKRLGFIGNSIELPHVYADAKTAGACIKRTRKALKIAVATLLEAGLKPPFSDFDIKRTEQVNIRLTAQEKEILSNAASNLGFEGISAFARHAALERVFSKH